ncbi:transporter substrate-binding domain-containing protein [Paenibacillus sedimenti]|uniref:Transporter substrate-binding domain-containing protein n=1 Tax=Paenibacillus sedimenti TaxID=2770274 RepID=A0A926KVP2_9BACL|nr:transporter substrate-binding domain-containing protein [Paenibacillus sedimenti]MBD0384397.1 transporter substrate-binding domain-containing protein [Paenibacillus sedimenti]
MIIRVRRKLGFGLVVSLLVFLLTSGCTTEKTIKVGIENNFRPFTFTEGGENKGFEVELWQAIAQKANIKYELVPMENGELSKSIKSGEVDLAISGMTITNARKNNLEYSNPYFQTGLVILTSSDNVVIKGKEDLAQKVVATQNGTTAYNYASEIQGVKIRSYPNISDAYDELKKKNVDAVIFDERNVNDFSQNTAEGKVKIVGELLSKESYVVVANKRNKYIGRVNQAIEAVSKDGTYEALYTKWFGAKPEIMPDKLKDQLEQDKEHET